MKQSLRWPGNVVSWTYGGDGGDDDGDGSGDSGDDGDGDDGGDSDSKSGGDDDGDRDWIKAAIMINFEATSLLSLDTKLFKSYDRHQWSIEKLFYNCVIIA